MSILRKVSRRGYSHIDNALADVEGLSFRARGICYVLLTKPDNWEIKIPYLMKMAKEGEQAIRTAMQELAEFGFLMRSREQDEQGRLRTVTYVADFPAYIDVGTVESRVNGYGYSSADLVETDMAVSGTSVRADLVVSERSVSRRSENREVGIRQVIVSTDLPNTDLPSTDKEKESGGKAAGAAGAAASLDVSKNHTLIVAFHDLHGRFPTSAQMKIIIERNPPVANWVRAIRAWAAAGHKPTNVAGMLDWAFDLSKIPTGPPSRRGNVKPTFVENLPSDYRIVELPDLNPDDDPLPWRAAMNREKKIIQNKADEAEEDATR